MLEKVSIAHKEGSLLHKSIPRPTILKTIRSIRSSGPINVESYIGLIIKIIHDMCYTPTCHRITTELEKLFENIDLPLNKITKAECLAQTAGKNIEALLTAVIIRNRKIKQLDTIGKELIRLSEKEKTTSRRWKKNIRENWDPEAIAKVVSKFRKPSGSNEDFIEEVLQLYPEAYLDIKELIRTKFKSERVINEIVAPMTNAQKVEEAKMHHCLIQKSRYKFEYIVGSDIDSKIKNHEIVFHDRIDKVNEDYVAKIESQMPLFAVKCPSKTITFSKTEFVYKTNNFVSLKTIIKFYRGLHA